MAPNISTKSKRDIGWEHVEMIDNNRMLTKCKYCGKEMKGSGVSRLKQHIAGGFSNVEKCEKCPVAISRAMREHTNNQKKENEDVLAQKAALREILLEPIRKKFGLDDDFVNEEESDEEIFPMQREHLKISIQGSIRDIHETKSGLGRNNLH
ncbi:hypothetical protein Salat_0840200 [Sesamum alatum]|uniref:BED-type domain-containing protein n=1 Tax=Sesamum alatum TaxID=300844 RepID=A0AAE1YIA5_9LAMI|nr:hypothetical protein Salat_0840200 [Sesamum alatum]